MNNLIEEQKAVCEKYSLNEDLVELNSLIAIGKNFNPQEQINGLRHPKTETLSGWYIWSGEDFNQNDDNFFQPLHAFHLVENAPFVLKYLGLPTGNRFLIDRNGYEDIWYDETLLDV